MFCNRPAQKLFDNFIGKLPIDEQKLDEDNEATEKALKPPKDQKKKSSRLNTNSQANVEAGTHDAKYHLLEVFDRKEFKPVKLQTETVNFVEPNPNLGE